MRAGNAVRIALAALGGYAAYAWIAQRRLETLDVETAGAPGGFVDIDGVRVHYVEAGSCAIAARNRLSIPAGSRHPRWSSGASTIA